MFLPILLRLTLISTIFLSKLVSAQLLGSTGNTWKCDLAQDGSGMLQEPVCCKKKTFLEKAMDGSLLTAEENCMGALADNLCQCLFRLMSSGSPLPGISDFVCEHAPDVWCCYRVVSKTAFQY